MLKEISQLNSVIFTFLATLPEETLKDLANGTLKLEISKKTTKTSDKSQKSPKINDICEHLQTITSREDATVYLQSLNLKRDELKEICDFYSIGVISSNTKALLTEKVIETVVGAKLRSNAIYNVPLK
ncbi:MAG: hypothetical protein FWG64_10595 [Firmicutes bacterium]|nr:hypothetical protein [Bacillota bacterium]